MVIEKARQTGSCQWIIGTGRTSLEGCRAMWGMKTTFPACFSPRIWHCRTLGLKSKRTIHVPMQSPLTWSMLQRSIKEQPFLSFKWARGRPGIAIELRNSIEYWWPWFLPSPATVSKPKSVVSSPGNILSKWVLMLSTYAFVVVRIVQSRKNELGFGWFAMSG